MCSRCALLLALALLGWPHALYAKPPAQSESGTSPKSQEEATANAEQQPKAKPLSDDTLAELQEGFFEKTPREFYGHHTTFWRPYSAVKNNLPLQPLEKLRVLRLHRFTRMTQLDNKWQDLGVDGSPMRPVYYTFPSDIGLTTGYTAYDAYWMPLKNQPYYHTRSPHTSFTISPGRKRACIALHYTQNVNKQWNVGADFTQRAAASPFNPEAKKRFLLSRNLRLFSSYTTRDKRYQVLGGVTWMSHNMQETGGLMPCKERKTRIEEKHKTCQYDEIFEIGKFNSPALPTGTLLLQALQQIRLGDKDKEIYHHSEDQRIACHLYNGYQFYSALQPYWECCWQHQRQRLMPMLDDESEKKDLQLVLPYTDGKIRNPLPANSLALNTWSNEIGLKGELGKFFYRIYVQRRDHTYSKDHIRRADDDAAKRHYTLETLSGLYLRYQLTQRQHCIAQGTFMNTKAYEGKVSYISPYFACDVAHLQHKVPLSLRATNVALPASVIPPAGLHQTAKATLHKLRLMDTVAWQTDFKNPCNTRASLTLKAPLPYICLEGGVSFTRLEHAIVLIPHLGYTSVDRKLHHTNGIHWVGNTVNESNAHTLRVLSVKPHQIQNPVYFFHPKARATLKLGGLHLAGELICSFPTNKLVALWMPEPRIFTNGSIYYLKRWPHKKLAVCTGLDVHWRDMYDGPAYHPLTQQFFIQPAKPRYGVHWYPIVDIFLNISTGPFGGFVRLSHALQGVLGTRAFATPWYLLPQRMIDIGFSWHFFD